MKVLQITAPGTYTITDLPEPACAADEVLIEIKACTICNQHDLAVFHGRPHGGPAGYPLEAGFPGHEGAGIVRQVGRDVQELAVGDHVVTTGIGGPPLYRQYVTRKASAAVRIAEAIDFVHAAPLELFGCVHHAFELTPPVKGRRVGVVGLGPAGQAAVALARAFGAAEVVAFDLDAGRRDKALEMGASAAVDAGVFAGAHEAAVCLLRHGQPDAQQQAGLDAVRAHQCDVLFECSGHPRSMETSFLLAGRDLTVFGYVTEPVEAIPAVWFHKELAIRTSRILSIPDLRAVVRLLEQGRIRTSPVVSDVMSFADYGEAIEKIARRRAIKIALVWE